MLIPTFTLFYYDVRKVDHKNRPDQLILTRTYIQAEREIIITVHNAFKNCFAGYL